MARQPFYGRGPGPAIARMDMNAATAPGRAYGQMYANLGKQVGDTIKEYQLNKEKRAELTGEIEGMLPQHMDTLTGTGNEVEDKKNFLRLEKFKKGDSSMADLKGLAGELAMKDKVEVRNFARETSEVNKKLLEQKFQTNETANKIAAENKDMKDQAFTGLLKRADEIKAKIDSGDIQYDDLFPTSKRLINDYDLIKNQQANPFEYAYSTDAESQAKLDKLEAEETKLDIKGKELGLTEETKEAAKMPEFNDKASALASVQDRDPGVSAKIVPFKGGFNVSMEFKAKDFPTSVQPLEGFDDVYSHGGYLYKGITDKNGKTTMTKIAAEQIGQRSDLLGKAIDRLDDKTLGNYRVAKRDGELNDDSDYEFTYRDPVTREEEEMTIPFNPILEERLKYVDELTSKYQKTLDEEIDLDLTIQ